MKVLATVPIWGEGYVDRFLRFTLPSLRQPGNLPAVMAAGHELEVVLYTSHEDAARLGPALSGEGIRWALHPLASREEPFFASCHGGTMMKDLFQRGFDLAWGQQAIFVPICADAVFSDNYLRSAVDMVTVGGKRAAMTQGGGANVQVIGDALDAMITDGVMRAPPRELMRVWLRAVGYGVNIPTWPGTRLYPPQIFFPVGEHGAIMRCCHVYPAALRAQRHAVMQYCPDNDLVEKTLDDYQHVGWMDNTDAGWFFGLAEPQHPSLLPAHPVGDTSLENFCGRWMSPWKAKYYGTKFLWHDGEMPPEDVATASAASDVVIDEILETYRAVGGTFI